MAPPPRGPERPLGLPPFAKSDTGEWIIPPDPQQHHYCRVGRTTTAADGVQTHVLCAQNQFFASYRTLREHIVYWHREAVQNKIRGSAPGGYQFPPVAAPATAAQALIAAQAQELELDEQEEGDGGERIEAYYFGYYGGRPGDGGGQGGGKGGGQGGYEYPDPERFA